MFVIDRTKHPSIQTCVLLWVYNICIFVSSNYKMEIISYSTFILLLCLNIIIEGSPAPFHRKGCMHSIVNPPKMVDLKQCRYGVTKDDCGRKHCMKGPGEFCGGVNHIYGRCAPGMECSDCNRCRGCSLMTLKCFEDECLKILYRYYGKAG